MLKKRKERKKKRKNTTKIKQNLKCLPVPSLEDDRDLSDLIPPLLLTPISFSALGENEPDLPLSEDESECRLVALFLSTKSVVNLGEPCPLSLAFLDSIGAM